MSAHELRKTDPAVIEEIDRLLDHHTEREIATILNQKGLCSGEGRPFHRGMIVHLRYAYHLRDRFTRLRAAGLLTAEEVADRLGIAVPSVKAWRYRGLLSAQRYNDKGQCLYEAPADHLPKKGAHKREYLQQAKLPTNETDEVQCEA